MAAQGDGLRYLPEAERHIPLSVKYADCWLLDAIQAEFGVTKTAAAIVLAGVEAHATGRPVSYSRSKDFYRRGNGRNPLISSYTAVVRGVDHLDTHGHIEHFKQVPGGLGWQSAFVVKPHLVAAVQRLVFGGPRLRLVASTALTLLRDAHGRPMPFYETREIQRQEGATAAFNEAIGAADIRLAGDHGTPFSLGSQVIRIFNGAFGRGGRFFARGVSWQNTPSKERARLLIDGEPTVELDWRATHPTLLYNEVGARPPLDCYAVTGWPRPLVKRALLILINAANGQQANGAIANCDEMKDFGKSGPEAKAEAAKLINDLKRLHKPIAHLFHSDAGARLMRIESDLAEAILKRVTVDQGIVALPLHDSFIVPAPKGAILKNEMLAAAHRLGLHGMAIETKSDRAKTTETAA